MKFSALAISLFILMLPLYSASQINPMPEKELTMLSLGDSYTIGEGMDEADRFPNQAVLLLHSKGIYFSKPEIIATTGWTTDELLAAITKRSTIQSYGHQPKTYDFVTLLIGVNNQYRGRDLENYRKEFVELLDQSIRFAGGKVSHIMVLSIPDWGVTPFAAGRDRKKISDEIDKFNEVNKEESARFKVNYIDITPFTREHPDWVAADGLHPDARQYRMWADEVVRVIEEEMSK